MAPPKIRNESLDLLSAMKTTRNTNSGLLALDVLAALDSVKHRGDAMMSHDYFAVFHLHEFQEFLVSFGESL